MARSTRRATVVVLLFGMLVSVGSLSKLARPQAKQRDGNAAVTPVPPAAPKTAADGEELGATYHWLEGKATKIVTEFPDGSVVSERTPDGDIHSRIADHLGNDAGLFIVDRVTGTNTQLTFVSGPNHVTIQSRADLAHTLEWANVQAYGLWKDRVSEVTDLEWRGRLVRAKESAAASPEDQPTEIRQEFENGVVATTTKKNLDALKVRPTAKRPTFVTQVTVNGADVGVMRWYEKDQTLSWDFPGLTKDAMNPETLKQVGGWTFKPTMAWATVQGLAFYDFRTKMKAQGKVARSCETPRNRLAEFFAPTVHADDLGCDYLHWLDGSVFRPCCDQHDRCYQQNGCGASSWYWPFGSSWSCTYCNAAVIFCFEGIASLCETNLRYCIEYQY